MSYCRFVKNNTLKVLFFISLFFCAMHFGNRTVVLAYTDEIRVGLTSLYSEKENIEIENQDLRAGYCVNDEFLEFTTLHSDSGFVFTSAKGYYVDLGLTMSSYSSLMVRYNAMTEELLVIPVVQSINSFKIYSGPYDDYNEAKAVYNSLIDKGYKNSKVLGSSNYRMFFTGETDRFLIDVNDDYTYPQFEPVGKKTEVKLIDLGERKYRGRLEVGTYGKTTLTAVNVVELEEYLYGVVPCEMPASWPIESLKAQAVCARSFAVAKATMRNAGSAKAGYKIVDTIESQVYRGYLYEDEITTKAVNATKGKTITYNNKVVAAYYFSSSAGMTESAENVWGFDLPYLQAVTDEYEGIYATAPWRVELTYDEMSRLIKQYSVDLGQISDVNITGVTESGRVSTIKVLGQDGMISLQTSAIRNVLGLKGTKFNLVKYGDNPDLVTIKYYDGSTGTREFNLKDAYVLSAEGTEKISQSLNQYVVKTSNNLYVFGKEAPSKPDGIYIYGIGSGHGVGMSQSGAAGMAAKGKNYEEIIKYYFKGCQL